MYVDKGYIAFDGTRVCFMAADTDTELHEMAGKLGLRQEIFPVGRSHVYSIPGEAMEKAVKLGAKLVDRRVILSNLRR